MPGEIYVENFKKYYGTTPAVEGLSFEVASGALFGLIGPDGAGKTTTMRTLCTLLPLEHGEMYVDGRDVRTEIPYIRSIVGYMPQRFSLYPDLTVQQNLNFFADLFGVPAEKKEQRIRELYQFSRLGPFKDRLASALSGGMKQKLALSCILVHTPRILILDEPTTGVDPVSRREFWNILGTLQEEGVTILVSTPYMDEASRCHRVAFMHKGRLLAVDRPEALVGRFPHALYEIKGPELHPLRDYLERSSKALSVQTFGDALHVSFGRPLNPEQIQRLRAAAPVPVPDFRPIRPTIEDTFLYLMKNEEASR